MQNSRNEFLKQSIPAILIVIAFLAWEPLAFSTMSCSSPYYGKLYYDTGSNGLELCTPVAATATATNVVHDNGAGLVGIGTTSPLRALHVAGTSSSEIILEDQQANANYRKWDLVTDGPSGTNSNFYVRQLNDAGSAGNVPFLINGTSGSVGIGTTAPTQLLHVYNPTLAIAQVDSTAGHYRVYRYATSGVARFDLGVETTAESGSNAGSNFYLARFNDAGAAIDYPIWITRSNGFIGVENSSPQYQLDVSSTASDAMQVQSSVAGLTYLDVRNTSTGTTNNGAIMRLISENASGSGVTTVDFVKYANGTFTINNNETSAAATTLFSVGSTERMRITSSGSVGIGTPAPSYTLQVNGSVAGTSAYANTSDGRLKTNVHTIPNALDKIRQLRGVGFDWREDSKPRFKFDRVHDIGLIAQEVEPVFPEAVSRDRDGYLSLAYGKLVPPLIEATKEVAARQSAQYEDLLRQNRMLRSWICEKDPSAALCFLP